VSGGMRVSSTSDTLDTVNPVTYLVTQRLDVAALTSTYLGLL